MFKELWEKSKGKIAIGFLTLILGLSAVTGFLGIKLLEEGCPEEAVCIVMSDVEKDVTPAEGE